MNEIRWYISLHENGCYETLNIVCPNAYKQIKLIVSMFKTNTSPWSSIEHMLKDMEYKDMLYTKVRKPSLIKKLLK